MRVIIRNDTPDVLHLHGADGRQIVLAPLEERRLADVDGFDLSTAAASGVVTQWEVPETDLAEKVLGAALVLAFGIGFAANIVRHAEPQHESAVWSGAAVVYCLVLAVLIVFWT